MSIEINVKDAVHALTLSKGAKWLPGFVIQAIGKKMYMILWTDGRSARRHVDQVKCCHCNVEDAVANGC